MDNVITLKMPSREQRLRLIVNFARELLFSYLDDANKKKLANISFGDRSLLNYSGNNVGAGNEMVSVDSGKVTMPSCLHISME
jgi:hypothetical protein